MTIAVVEMSSESWDWLGVDETIGGAKHAVARAFQESLARAGDENLERFLAECGVEIERLPSTFTSFRDDEPFLTWLADVLDQQYGMRVRTIRLGEAVRG
jgi:hypothetical protein